MDKIQTTVISGALGAGKTTLIKNLIEQLPSSYKTLWLKNEYGDVNLDSQLARESNIETKEILNGCLCCVLVGKLSEALEEIVKDYKIDRLIIETAGTAYPYPIVHEVNKVSKLKFDGLVVVVDALNFDHFKDKSVHARNQSKYVDLIVVNKSELVEKDKLEEVLDEVYDLYPSANKIITPTGYVDKEIVFGLEPIHIDLSSISDHYHDQIETFSLKNDHLVDIDAFKKLLDWSKEQNIFRIKGILNSKNGFIAVNFVNGRYDFLDLKSYKGKTQIVFMGKRINEILEEKLRSKFEDCKVA